MTAQDDVLGTHVCDDGPVIIGHTEPLTVTGADIDIH